MATEAVEEGSGRGGGAGAGETGVPSPLEGLGADREGVVQVGVAGGDHACAGAGGAGGWDEGSSSAVVEWESVSVRKKREWERGDRRRRWEEVAGAG